MCRRSNKLFGKLTAEVQFFHSGSANHRVRITLTFDPGETLTLQVKGFSADVNVAFRAQVTIITTHMTTSVLKY